MKNKKKIAIITAMTIGTATLAGAVYANNMMSNGYEVAKTAIKGLGENENYTSSVSAKMFFDGEEIASEEIKELYDRDGDVIINTTNKSTSYGGFTSDYQKWIQDDKVITVIDYTGNELDSNPYTLVEENASKFLNLNGCFDELHTENENESKAQQKVIKFVELVADTFIGDLKNNIVYVSGDENSSTYEMNLDSIQIPEIANAGLSAVFSSMNYTSYNEDYSMSTDEPLELLGTEPTVKNVSLKFTVDNDSRLTDGNLSVAMTGRDASGENHELTLTLSIGLSNYGTTLPERVDISTLPNVHTEDAGDVYAVPTEDEEASSEIRIEKAE